jgi:hypothetical protein
MDQLVTDILKTAAGAVLGALFTYRIWIRQKALELRQAYDTGLLDARRKAYGRLWRQFSVLALHAAPEDVSGATIQALSKHLRSWYFKDGLVLSERARDVYFVLQEFLDLVVKHAEAAHDPPYVMRRRDESLNVDQVNRLREQLQLHSLKGPLLRQAPAFRRWLDATKLKIRAWQFGQSKRSVNDFVVVQFLASSLRTALANDLSSRDPSLVTGA